MWTTFRSVPRDRRAWGRSRLAQLVGVCAVLYPARAFAQAPTPIELTWNVPENCPPASTVLSRIREIAGPSGATGAPLRAEATVTRQGERAFRMRLAIRSGDLAAERVIDGKSCKDLAGAAAVTLALLLSSEEPLSERDLAGDDPASAVSQDSAPVPEKPPPSAQSQPAPAPAIQPEIEDRPESGARGEVAERATHALLVVPLVAVSVGPTSQVSRGLGIAAGVSVDGWRFLADGKLWAAQRSTLTTDGDEYGVDFNRFSVSARGCRRLWTGRFDVAPCVLMSVQHLAVRGDGPNLVPKTDTATWLSAGVGVQAHLLVASWFALLLGLDAELQFSRPEIELRGVGFVGRLAPAAATLSAGSEWIF